jgi:16S rRNA processing protein RimM
MAAEADSGSFVIVGRIRKAHGLRGELIVESLTDTPDAVFAPGRRVFAGTPAGDIDPKRLELRISGVRVQGEGLRIAFEDIADRSAAERWRDRYLLVPEDEVEPLGEGQVYLHELREMRVELMSGEVVGTVTGLFELPQGVVLEVQRDSDSVIVPYESAVVSVDRETRVVRIDPPAGLLD